MGNFRRAVFLDRDGIINEIIFRNGKLSAPYSLTEFRFLPKVKEAIALFKRNGFLRIVVTNQPEIGRGDYSEKSLQEIHQLMNRKLDLNAVYFCPHDKDGGCSCKKPSIGLVEKAKSEFGIDLSRSFVVGDRWRDIELGKRSGCRTILVNTQATALDTKLVKPDYMVNNLLEAAHLTGGEI